MNLVQILLPVTDNQGQAFPPDDFADVLRQLTERFGGATAFADAPAEGFWREGDRPLERDRVVLIEVMTEGLDRAFWSAFRKTLEARFRQEAIVVRALAIERL